jgi:hypothetical protein
MNIAVFPSLQLTAMILKATFTLSALFVAVYVLYRWLLPRPLPGIPYNKEAARHILGDIPALLGADEGEDFSAWVLRQTEKLQSPLVQLFIKPFSRPVLVLADCREAQDMLLRRHHEFDRSSLEHDMFSGISPTHHINRKTDSIWKAHRSLLQDLMTPSFLNKVAAPAIHTNALSLVELWDRKAEIAAKKPFSALEDIHHATLDAVLSFSFGGDLQYSAVRPQLDVIRNMDASDIARVQDRSKAYDQPILFPPATMDSAIQATLDLTASVETILATPKPKWTWWFLKWTTRMRKALRVRDQYMRTEVLKSVGRLAESGREDTWVRSAVDHIVQRVGRLAEKANKEPEFLSADVLDEVKACVLVSWSFMLTSFAGLRFRYCGPRYH